MVISIVHHVCRKHLADSIHYRRTSKATLACFCFHRSGCHGCFHSRDASMVPPGLCPRDSRRGVSRLDVCPAQLVSAIALRQSPRRSPSRTTAGRFVSAAQAIRPNLVQGCWPGIRCRSLRSNLQHSPPGAAEESQLHLRVDSFESCALHRRNLLGRPHHPWRSLAPRPPRSIPETQQHASDTTADRFPVHCLRLDLSLENRQNSRPPPPNRNLPHSLVLPVRRRRHSLRHGNSLRTHRTAHGHHRHRPTLHHRHSLRHSRRQGRETRR